MITLKPCPCGKVPQRVQSFERPDGFIYIEAIPICCDWVLSVADPTSSIPAELWNAAPRQGNNQWQPIMSDSIDTICVHGVRNPTEQCNCCMNDLIASLRTEYSRIRELEAEVAAMKRGEYICTKCGLRQDAHTKLQPKTF